MACKRYLCEKGMGVRIPRIAISLGLVLVTWATIPAQQRCGTSLLTQDRAARFPMVERQAHSEAGYRRFITSTQGGGPEYLIPVVVHLIQQSNVAVISDARVQSQIDVLNEDFSKLNADTSLIPLEFQGVAADSKVRFCLASIDPDGCPTDGINRVVHPELAVHSYDEEAALKGLTQWDPFRYLNIWVPVSMDDGLLGYATFPTWLNFDPGSDGIVVNGTAFGRGNGTPASTYNQGRTTTHEVGHWLGLYHTFQDGCAGNTPQSCSSQGDRVCDTPPTQNSNFGCPAQQNTCTETPVDAHDQTMNYMDYVDDACMYMFSAGQRDRMHYFLTTDRSFIWSDSNLRLTGCDGTVSPGCMPHAAFTSASRAACVGQPVQFSDLSVGPASSWDWTFQGGTPATSLQQHPQVTWSQPGTYAVSLRVTNVVGSDSVTVTAYITVATSATLPLMESFEASASLPWGWQETSQSNQWHWETSTDAASHGQRSMVARNFDQIVPVLRKELFSAPYDLSGMTSSLLTFDHAFKRRGGFNVDSLQVHASTDCGETWQLAWSKSGLGLATVTGFQANGPFLPTPSQWRKDTVDLSAYTGATDFRLMFRSVGGNSQDLYLDNLNLSVLVGTPVAETPLPQVRIFPNPAWNVPRIEFSAPAQGPVEATLLDANGNTVVRWPGHRCAVGWNSLHIPAAAWGKLAQGLYLLRLEASGTMTTAKIVKLSPP